MSAVHDLAAAQNGNGADPISAAEQLEALWDLQSIGRTIRGARWIGKGPASTVDVHLDDGSTITFEKVADIANATRLAMVLVSYVGATPKLKAPQAIQSVALLRVLAEHEDTLTADHVSREWGITYLQNAPTQAVDVNDQAARWSAFCALRSVEPVIASQQQAITIAAASVVLVHTDGTRLVRCGWFRAHAKAEDPGASPQEIAHRMLRVGWQQRGAHGRIKATCPGRTGSLVWTFYAVPAGWEDQP